MANNCYNYITISGSVEEIADFKKLLEIDKEKGQDNGNDIYENLCFEFEKHGNDARWFNIDVHDFFKDDSITISGDSAWCPCLDLFTKISKRFKSFIIRYEYEESGCDFAGYAEIKEGFCNDNCFGYWVGKTKIDYSSALEEALSCCELEYFETEEELIDSDMYKAFEEWDKKTILDTFLEINS